MSTVPLPKMSSKKIGELKIHSLVDSVGAVRRVDEMMIAPKTNIISDNIEWLLPNYIDESSEYLVLSYQSFVLQKDGISILVDAAIGEDGNYPARPDWHRKKSNWLNHLGQAGLSPLDIDYVFLTHLHMDHTGWLTRYDGDEWVPTFPNARHIVSQVELNYWSEQHSKFPYMASSMPDSVFPIHEAKLFEFAKIGDELIEGISIVDLAGHSPGMIGLEYSENKNLLASFCADLMHHPLQMTAPEMCTLFCYDTDAAAETRIRKLEEYATKDTIIFCGHFPGESAGHVLKIKNGFKFAPIK